LKTGFAFDEPDESHVTIMNYEFRMEN
jgi:hypothetical protein